MIAARKRAESARTSRPSYSLDGVAERLGIGRSEADGSLGQEVFGLGEVHAPILAPPRPAKPPPQESENHACAWRL
jgi:hypothetical protein